MRIAVVLTCLMVFVVLAKGGQMFEPLIDVFDQSTLVVIHINAGSNMHSRNQHHAFFDATFVHDLLHLLRNMHVRPMSLRMKLYIFGMHLHGGSSRNDTHQTSFADNALLSPWTRLRAIGKRFGTLLPISPLVR